MSERFHVEPDGKYFAIYWGPTLICTVWSTREFAQSLCDLLEGTRQMDVSGDDVGALIKGIDLHKAGWEAFRDSRQAGRE